MMSITAFVLCTTTYAKIPPCVRLYYFEKNARLQYPRACVVHSTWQSVTCSAMCVVSVFLQVKVRFRYADGELWRFFCTGKYLDDWRGHLEPTREQTSHRVKAFFANNMHFRCGAVRTRAMIVSKPRAAQSRAECGFRCAGAICEDKVEVEEVSNFAGF